LAVSTKKEEKKPERGHQQISSTKIRLKKWEIYYISKKCRHRHLRPSFEHCGDPLTWDKMDSGFSPVCLCPYSSSILHQTVCVGSKTNY